MRLIIALILFIIIDAVFIYFSTNHWKNQIRLIQNTNMKINYYSAIMAYILMYVGWYYFIYLPNNNKKSYDSKLLIDAFMLGFIIYGIFELTNKSLFNKWSWMSVLIDTIWGGILYMLVTLITFSYK